MPQIKYTKPFLKAVSPGYIADFQTKLEKTLTKFPELVTGRVDVGVTTSSTANAQNTWMPMTERIKIGYNPSVKPTHHVLGHELTHFVQHISDIPQGEVQCDIWTIARDSLFLDIPPCYLKIPVHVLGRWSAYADAVRGLCIEAINQRANGCRRYIVWLEKELMMLGAHDD